MRNLRYLKIKGMLITEFRDGAERIYVMQKKGQDAKAFKIINLTAQQIVDGTHI
jgi:hypothetical protein